jgi:hypothetical protein
MPNVLGEKLMKIPTIADLKITLKHQIKSLTPEVELGKFPSAMKPQEKTTPSETESENKREQKQEEVLTTVTNHIVTIKSSAGELITFNHKDLVGYQISKNAAAIFIILKKNQLKILILS